ncbi:AAA family ATPase [uncultured Megasphaera sp.]|uniref:McrB family protein n=1 Tax=uncultured Megasphaera sp. TaxID=165188 RepID=UPI0026149EE6|nr:AAA family ATPase [uncultured Megasphaera sp.]
MAIRPDNITTYSDIDLKLGIKSSLPHVKSAIALAILFWECSDHPSELIYSASQKQGKVEEIVVAPDLNHRLINFLSNICNQNHIELNRLTETVNQNSLFKSQIEALIVAFELIWKIARVNFVDSNKSFSVERTGGNRYQKKLNYTLNADIIHCLIESDRNTYLRVLLSWIGLDLNIDHSCEERLTHLLCALSEEAVFKLVDGENDIIFNQNCIYEKLIEKHQSVNIDGDKEAKGSLRILKSLLNDKLNPFLKYHSGNVDIADGYDDALSSYQKRVDTFLQLSAKKIDLHDEEVLPSKICEDSTSNSYHVSDDSVFSTELKSSYPRNRIIFGAPGTGKSWQLDTDKNKLLENGGEFERVTFHPDYTYSQFVGAYKPTTDENGEISYQFVPGPFMRIYVNALKNSRTDYPQPYLLIIEEINRARVASVFGDIFQLLDRKEDGTSQYAIQASEDIKKYLAAELGGQPSYYPILKIPNNMFLWATMNSADQGVYPMDTAFKRRWTFEYISIDAKQEEVKCTVNLVKDNPETNVNWNRLRKAINAKLLDTCRVNEDKLLGPFFLSKKAIKADEANHIIDEEAFRKAFKSKVIMYLFEDAARQYRSRLFKSDICKIYSSICDEFDKHGMAIFGDDFKSAYYDQQKD